MDDSPAPSTAKSDGNLNPDALKSKKLDHSPARLSVKSLKATVIPKAKRNCSSPTENVNQKDSAATQLKQTSSALIATSGATPPEKSKIPTMRKMAMSYIPKSKPTAQGTQQVPQKAQQQQKQQQPQQQPQQQTQQQPQQQMQQQTQQKPQQQKQQQPQQKPPQQQQQPEKKQPTQTQKQFVRNNSRSSLSKLELKTKAAASSNTKLNFQKSALPSTNQGKTTLKCQSARSSSESPDLYGNKRSDSTVSSHSTPCTRKKLECETNLCKMASTAGDQKIEKVENSLQNQDQKELVATTEKKPVKSAEPVNEFKNKIKGLMNQWFSSFRDELNSSDISDTVAITEATTKLQQMGDSKSNDILSFIDDWCPVLNNDVVDKYKKELEESKRSLKRSEKKYNELTKQHEEEKSNLEKEFSAKLAASLAKKDEDIKEIHKKIKAQEKQTNIAKTNVQHLEKEKDILQSEKNYVEEELKHSKDTISEINKKLHDTEQQVKHEKKELKSKTEIIKKLENDLANKNKLEKDLIETTLRLEDLQTRMNKKTHNECVEHEKQITELESKINSMEADMDALQQQNEKLEQDLSDFGEVREKLAETLKQLEKVQAELDEKSKILDMYPEDSKNMQLELAKCRQSEAEKRREIEKLKIELSKTQFNMCQLEQQIQRDQQLLEVRSGLISSLQTNEKTHRMNMEELFTQVGEKNNTINELNSELQAKSEEFRNLFTTLSAKQMEVANQEHIIKLLEESNERSQMLRVKQEEKIGRLEEELAHLKQTIAICRANVLTGKSGRHLFFTPGLPPNTADYNENFYYYLSQRKRKRQVDINVKKYEA